MPIPGAVLTVERTKGPPNVGTMELPALTSICLKIDSDTASANVTLDDTQVLGPSDFKNSPSVQTVGLKDLSAQKHAVTVKVAGKPGDDRVTVRAYYSTVGLGTGSLIQTPDEALLVGQAYIDEHAEMPMFAGWAGDRRCTRCP